jgi:hypothetical protein
MSAEVTVLEGGPLFAIKKKQRKVWQEIGERILALPQKQREIILEDFLTAIQNRLIVMERVSKIANRNSRG